MWWLTHLSCSLSLRQTIVNKITFRIASKIKEHWKRCPFLFFGLPGTRTTRMAVTCTWRLCGPYGFSSVTMRYLTITVFSLLLIAVLWQCTGNLIFSWMKFLPALQPVNVWFTLGQKLLDMNNDVTWFPQMFLSNGVYNPLSGCIFHAFTDHVHPSVWPELFKENIISKYF